MDIMEPCKSKGFVFKYDIKSFDLIDQTSRKNKKD